MTLARELRVPVGIPLSLLIVAMLCPMARGQVIYVDDDAGGTNDGTSWVNAYVCLQDALADANGAEKPIEIHVARGFYKPDQGEHQTKGDREATFQLIDGVAVCGGYAGLGAPDPNVRDVEAYETILSGDIGASRRREDNSYHVVVGSGTGATAVLDGVTVRHGNANDPTWEQYRHSGGGMLVMGGSPTLDNCTFTGNRALYAGGGLAVREGSPTLTCCRFLDNSCEGDGGGIFNGDSSPVLTDCAFTNNWAGDAGGAMRNKNRSSPLLTNCTFSQNSATNCGGGVQNTGPASASWENSPRFADCAFIANSAGEGGGMQSFECDPNLINCTFVGNSAEGNGGGMAFVAGSPIIESCTVRDNRSQAGGGISCSDGSRLVISDSVICDNSADAAGDSKGGGLFFDQSSPVVRNCTFVGNRASPVLPDDALLPGTGGGAICCANDANAVVCGSTFIDNRSTDDGGAICCHYSRLQVTGGTFLRNIAVDAGGAMYLQASQPADVTNSLFERNEASTGGAVFSRDLTTLNIHNCTLAHNSADRGGGVRCSLNGTVGVIWNSLLWDNAAPVGGAIALADDAILQVGYSNVAGGSSGVGRAGQSILLWDEGNLDVDPLFAQSGYWDPNDMPDDPSDDVWVDGDYHLRSEVGRWDPAMESWVMDDVTSPCIDGGDPNSPVALEPFPNGGIVNMGAYGGTVEASKSTAR